MVGSHYIKRFTDHGTSQLLSRVASSASPDPRFFLPQNVRVAFFPPSPAPTSLLIPSLAKRTSSFVRPRKELRFSISRVVFPFLLLRFSVTIQDEDVIRSRERGKKGETNKRESFQKIEGGKSEGKKKNWFLLLEKEKKKIESNRREEEEEIFSGVVVFYRQEDALAG